MTDPAADPACLFDVVADREAAPLVPLTGGQVSDFVRIELLRTLLHTQYAVADLMNCVRACPDDNETADNIAGVIGATMMHAGTLLTRLQNTRECQGQG
ncbi:hypothetical protein MKK55_28845 [Methylobacterium sp. J-059]|uniref:hypothetical protein n=1 Tax=Methylobacterium sp. J-059 TaxID=2836643 RepID=UPI001FB8CB15|nr:hypothetical protein [Methylobacterium sp. J-059]MCJ2042925.1 hypothetical protein [Methylobacterium sp. J-059]